MEDRGKIIGIDLGTINSAAAVMEAGNHHCKPGRSPYYTVRRGVLGWSPAKVTADRRDGIKFFVRSQ